MSATWDSLSGSRPGRGYCDRVSALRVANAPVSFGAFELTATGARPLPDPDAVLGAIAEAGYEGTELGPPGYLGEAAELPRRHGLELVAGFAPLPDLPLVLDLLEAGGGRVPVLADTGPRDGEMDTAEVQKAADLCRARGFEPAFHPHMGTRVETPAEIQVLLESTDVGLVLDTGHLLRGGGDPVRAVREWGDRVVHVHLKDVRDDVFCELGSGEVDLDGVLGALRERGYEGWLVIEQDRILEPGEDIAEAAAAQARNLRWLERHVEPQRA
jgi:inosose dehydratase